MISKLNVIEWKDGTVFYYWFEDNIFGLNNYFKDFILNILSNYFIISIITWSVLILELLLALAIIMDYSKRKILIPLGISFHFFIWLAHGLPTFFITMTGALLIYLIPFDFVLNLNKLQITKN